MSDSNKNKVDFSKLDLSKVEGIIHRPKYILIGWNDRDDNSPEIDLKTLDLQFENNLEDIVKEKVNSKKTKNHSN
jgi:hypothetical protein